MKSKKLGILVVLLALVSVTFIANETAAQPPNRRAVFHTGTIELQPGQRLRLTLTNPTIMEVMRFFYKSYSFSNNSCTPGIVVRTCRFFNPNNQVGNLTVPPGEVGAVEVDGDRNNVSLMVVGNPVAVATCTIIDETGPLDFPCYTSITNFDPRVHDINTDPVP